MSQIGTGATFAAEIAASRTTPSGLAGRGRLLHAAVEFESVLLGQWFQSAEKSFGTVPGDDSSEDAQGEQMMGFAMQQVAQAIARTGGFGIARLVEQGLEHASAGESGKAATAAGGAVSALPAKLPAVP